MSALEWCMAIAIVGGLMPPLAYFIAKFAAYGWYRGRELYKRSREQEGE